MVIRYDLYHDVGGRIKELRQALRLSQKEFAKAIGLSQSRLSEIEHGEPTKEAVLVAISSKFNVSLEWLKTGKGDMWAKKPQAEEVYPVEVVAVPVITSVGAGGYIYTPDHVLIERSKLKTKTIVAFKVDGDSMEPTIQKGEFVLVEETDKEPIDGYVYLIGNVYGDKDDNGLKVRRLRLINNEWWAFCDNPAYPPEKLTDEVKIVGRVELIYRPAELRKP